MKRIFAWQTDSAGCYMYRIYWPLTHLDKTKFEVNWGAPGPDIFDYDVVIGQRIAGQSALWQQLCADPNIFTVYDIDDNLLAVDQNNTVPYSIYDHQREGTAANIKAADIVTVASSSFAEWLTGSNLINSEVAVLPNCLLRSWMQYRPPPNPPILGWAGSMFHGQDFTEEATAVVAGIRLVKQVLPSLQLHMIGANYLPTSLPTRTTGWSTMDAYHDA